jgi:hypothetical protein
VEKGMTFMKTYMEDENVETMIQNFQLELTPEDRIEFITILEKMLFFGPSQSMKQFVRILLDQMDDLPSMIRCRMLEYVYEADDVVYIQKLRQWLRNDDMELACRVYWLKQLSYYPLYTEEQHVEDWVSHVFLHVPSPFHRNKIVMDAFHTYEENKRFPIYITIMREYKNIFEDPVMYRVTFAQNLVKKEEELEDHTFLLECLEELATIMNDPHYPFESQADICDFFLNTEQEIIRTRYHTKAEIKMQELFRENMVSELSIYANRQNVHSSSIEKSAETILEKLHEKYGLRPTTLEQLQQWRLEMESWDVYLQQDELTQHKVSLCMNRIFFDKRLYGSTKDTLVTIFGLVWRHVHHSEHEKELQQRLLEEMMEASGQCSTGIAVRLVNTLSGYDDFMLTISYKEAILSKVMHHMNTKIMEIADKELQEVLLYEMILPPSQYTSRKNFLEFFRKNIATIKEELYQEYQEFVSDTDFDLYLKQALIVYEG